MTGELTPIGPVTSPPEEKSSRVPPESGPDVSLNRPPAPAARVDAVSEARKARQQAQGEERPVHFRPETDRKPAPEQIEELAEKFSEHLENLHSQGYLRELRLDYENLEGGDLMVKIMDARTDKVIREIPPEDQVEFAKRMEEVLGLIMDELA
jgi:flagellar protein FlaG